MQTAAYRSCYSRLAQPSLEGHLHVGRQCGVNTLGGNEKAKEAVVVLALRKAPGVSAIFSGLRQGEFEREILTEIGAQKRVGALPLPESRTALVERGAD